MDVILGGKLISSATNTYAHRSTLEVLLNYDKEAAESQLGCGLFCKNTAGQMEEMDMSAMNGQKRTRLSNYRVGFTQTYLMKENLF